jgi:hypothetical protein
MISPLKQYIAWRTEPHPEGGKPIKVPVNYQTGDRCDAHDARNWTDYNTAAGMAPVIGATGVGFVITTADPMVCIDLDNCLQPDGMCSPLANDVLARFPDAYVEVSHSGKGLHIWFQGQAPVDHRTRGKEAPGLEVYSCNRFIALGRWWKGDPNVECTAALTAALGHYLPGTTAVGAEWTDEPVAEWNGPTDDDELIRKMLASKPSAAAVFGGGASVRDLWEGNVDKLGDAYPSESGDAFNHSAADMALMAHLAFWTGKDCARMDRLFRQSGLMREKWDREGYSYRTTTRACGGDGGVYTGGKTPAPVPSPDGRPTGVLETGVPRDGVQYLTIQEQLTRFQHCVYISSLHRALLPNGMVLKPEQFNVVMGGYEFAMQSDGAKSTKLAWEAFTQNRAAWFPQVECMAFRPDKAPGLIEVREGLRYVNAYVPANVVEVEGDVSPFLDLLARQLPVERDRRIMLSFMAAVVQHIGHKFQWAPVLQGVQGNGKTFFMQAVAYCVGERYSHFPNPADLGNKFNPWLENKLFIGVEEIYTKDKMELAEALKPLITNRRIEIQGKGRDQVTGDNMANFMLSTNHKDGVRKTENDRRYSVFYTAQQDRSDLTRDGMTSPYFPNLYKWARGGGYAAIAYYLRRYAIEDAFNPAGACDTAPDTSSTVEAMQESLGGIEQEVVEAIGQGRAGFRGGWISSTALTHLLRDIGAVRYIHINKRRELLNSLGFVIHPRLDRGRTTTEIMQEGNRPVLYVKPNHLSVSLKDPGDVTAAYRAAQGYDAGALGTIADRSPANPRHL